MGNVITRPIASAAERIAASTYLWGSTGSSPATDRRFAATDILMKDASGNFSLGSASLGIGLTPNFRLHVRQAADGVQALIGGLSKAVRIQTNTNETIVEGVSHDFATFQRLVIGGLAVGVSESGVETFRFTGGHLLPQTDNIRNFGSGALRMSTIFAGTGAINTSDEREKTDIGDIPDEWLDAWSGVQWQRFKMIGGNRWHVGLVAQSIHAAFAAHDLDAFDIGLCCFDAWEEQREPIFDNVTKTRKVTRTEPVAAGENEEGEPLFTLQEVEFEEEYEETVDTGETRVTLEAGDRWGLRYDECQAIEAAWQRRELSRLTERLAALGSPST